jgi:hypothetical protein
MPLSPAPEPLVVGAAWAKGEVPNLTERFLKCAQASALKQ